VSDVSFNVAPRTVHSIIGPNGAGKTTLFNLITGAITPDAGSVTFRGQVVTGFRPASLVRIGVVRTFQRTRIFRSMTLIENVAQAIRARRRLNRAIWLSSAVQESIDAEAHGTLVEVGLAQYAGATAATLSHGNQRALDLAIGVALQPTLMLMDEPLAGMAQGDRERIALLILRLRDERGLSIVIVEHDIGMVMRLSDRITVMQRGKVIAEGSATEIRNDATVKEAYLHGNFSG
jgi:branched-chain amino acid transport system ATP-binding protein